MNPIVMQNQNMRLTFSPETGALTQAVSLKTGWRAFDRPELATPFILQIPMPDRQKKNNLALGENHRLACHELSADGRHLKLCWQKVTSQFGGTHDIDLEMTVDLDEAQATFALTIDNRSPYIVESASYPVIADLRAPEGCKKLEASCFSYCSQHSWEVWPHFSNHLGYFGFDTPIQANRGAPGTPYTIYHDQQQGLYLGAHDKDSEVVAWVAELFPGYDESINSRVPQGLKIGDKPVSTRVRAAQLPYVTPGERRTLAPVALCLYQGDWQDGANIFTTWRESWQPKSVLPDWVRDVHAWQQIHINSPEDELRIRFTDLVEVGRECAKHGVKAIQLVGWNDGGQDQGNPSHDPDPRLGTFEELNQAIAEIQKMGVKMILFTKFVWADRATERYRNELYRSAIKDPYGDDYVYAGYRYQTLAQALDVNTKRLIPMCFYDEAYMKVCEEEFKKVVALGADGMIFDECLHHGAAICCFDESHGHRYGAPVYARDNDFIRRLSKLAPKDFLMGGEAIYDRETETYHLSYHRSESIQHVPLMRYLSPKFPTMTAVTGFDDRNMIGQCLMYRYIISYEPYNFKGHLDDYPATMAYGTKMDALRTELRAYFWDGDFLGAKGAKVTDAKGEAHHPYAVFRHVDGQAHGIAACNYGDEPVTLKAKLDNGAALSRYRLIDDDAWKPAEVIVIPPRSAAIIV